MARTADPASRRALVTGASGGLGRALCRELLGRGWSVAGVARRESELRETFDAVPHDPARSFTRALDVTDAAALEAAIAEASRRFDGLDVAIANAGIGVPGPLATQDHQAIRRVFEVNVFAAMHTLTASLPHLRRSSAPCLVGVSSLASFRGGPHAGPYNGSKAAFSRMLEALRAELAEDGIPVLEIAPGFVRTPMTDRNPFPMPFLVEPEKAAVSIRRALDRGRSHLAFPWQLALPMGVLRRLPDGLFDRVARGVTRRLRRRDRLG